MATSQLPKIICPILIIWLKYRKHNPNTDVSVANTDKNSSNPMNAASIIQRLRTQTSSTTQSGLNMSLINQLLTSQFT